MKKLIASEAFKIVSTQDGESVAVSWQTAKGFYSERYGKDAVISVEDGCIYVETGNTE